jgi:hypothetical protein
LLLRERGEGEGEGEREGRGRGRERGQRAEGERERAEEGAEGEDIGQHYIVHHTENRKGVREHKNIYKPHAYTHRL